MNSSDLRTALQNGDYDSLFTDIYVDERLTDYQRTRYIDAVNNFTNLFQEGEVSIYSAPGRTEIGGNHTDHQHGAVLAASINLDAIAVVRKTDDNIVQIVSDGYPLITVSTNETAIQPEESGNTAALIRGVLSGVEKNGYAIGGFVAYITSDVLIGAGLSSSAAFETLLGTILSGLYNDGRISAVEIAKIGQYAERDYFGKPCGLMDQTASSVGNLVTIDFENPAEPYIAQIDFDMSAHGYNLCITDTKGSHADLTGDYAAIPYEMKQIASFFGEEVLRPVPLEALLASIPELRAQYGDRAVLRALHFKNDHERVSLEVAALKAEDIDAFLRQVRSSGQSSFQYLQNVYSNQDPEHQNLSIALAVSDTILDDTCASRVHGGGFAGTIQTFLPDDKVDAYKSTLDDIFGKDACRILKIRKYGGMCVIA